MDDGRAEARDTRGERSVDPRAAPWGMRPRNRMQRARSRREGLLAHLTTALQGLWALLTTFVR